MWVPSRTLVEGALKLLNSDTIPATSMLDGSVLAFLKAPVDLGFDTTYGDVSPSLATDLGYPPVAVTWAGPFIAQGGFSLLSGGGHVIEMGGSDSAVTMYGHVLLGSDSFTYLGGELYDVPVPLGSIGAGYADNPLFGIGPNQAGFGNSIVSR